MSTFYTDFEHLRQFAEMLHALGDTGLRSEVKDATRDMWAYAVALIAGGYEGSRGDSSRSWDIYFRNNGVF